MPKEFFKKQQTSVHINKIDLVTEVVSINLSEQTKTDVSKLLLDKTFDSIITKMGVHEEVLDYELDEDDIYDKMPTEKTIKDFINLF